MYFLPRRLTYCSQILSNYNVPVVASSTGDPAGFLLSVSSSRRLSECLRPTTQKGEETLLVRPRTTYWASRTSSERVDQAPGKPAEPDNIIIRGRSAEKQAIPCEVGPDNHWEDKLEPKPAGNLDRPETREVVEGDHLEYHGEDQHEQKLNT